MMLVAHQNGRLFHTLTVYPENYKDVLTAQGYPSVETDAIPGFDMSRWWFDGALLQPRPSLDLPSAIFMSVGEVRSFSVPSGAEVIFDGQSFPIEDGALELSADYPGDRAVIVRAFPYLDHRILITVTP